MRATRAISLLLLPLVLFLPTAARGEDPVMDIPVLNEQYLGRTAMDLMNSYTKEALAAWEGLDKLMNTPMRDQSMARPAAEEICDRMIDLLGAARTAAQAFAKGKPVSGTYDEWFTGQLTAWKYTRAHGGGAAMWIARIHDARNTFKKNWIPKLAEKSAEALKIGKEITKAYAEFEAAIASGLVDKTRVEAFRIIVILAKNTGSTLHQLKRNLRDEIKRFDEEEKFTENWADYWVDLANPTVQMPAETIWSTHYRQWVELLRTEYVDMTDNYEKAKKACQPFLKHTLFDDLGPPLAGLDFDEIGPAFVSLLDRVKSSR